MKLSKMVLCDRETRLLEIKVIRIFTNIEQETVNNLDTCGTINYYAGLYDIEVDYSLNRIIIRYNESVKINSSVEYSFFEIDRFKRMADFIRRENALC